jgi:AraC-like DNA-binding protein
MALAIQYLDKHPYASIEHVAACVGYRDHSAFGRRFRQVHGCSPSAWRLRQG